MIGAYKQFDQDVHDACDPPARDAVIKWIDKNWKFQCEGYDKYKVDLVCSKHNTNRFYVEIECRQWFTGKDIRYPTIHVPERKEKLFNNDLRTVYFVVSGDFKHGLYTDVENIKSSPKVEVKNTAIPEGEYFFDVPTDKWNYVQLEN